jgi:hypothetical protein
MSSHEHHGGSNRLNRPGLTDFDRFDPVLRWKAMEKVLRPMQGWFRWSGGVRAMIASGRQKRVCRHGRLAWPLLFKGTDFRHRDNKAALRGGCATRETPS